MTKICANSPSNIYYIKNGFGYLKVGNCQEVKINIEQLDIIKKYRWKCNTNSPPKVSGYKHLPISKILYPNIKSIKYKDKNKYNLTLENVEDIYRQCWIENNICYIPLSNGKIAICDASFFEIVKNYLWCMHGDYVVTYIKNASNKYNEVLLHNLLFPDVCPIFFINKNKLDHRECNISEVRRKCWVEGDICRIPLQTGQEAICSSRHYDKIKNICFFVDQSGYARCKINNEIFLLHRFLFPEYEMIDHKNRNRLDNRDENIRKATFSQNMANSSKKKNTKFPYKGVRKDKNKYYAVIKGKILGGFYTIEEAAQAYDKAAKEIYGEFACLNFPEIIGETK